MAKFITLTTDRSSAIGAKIRVNADMMIGYGPADDAGRQGWSWIEVNDQCGGVRYVMETPEQIDAMLAVTEKPSPVAELVAAIELVRGIIADAAPEGFNPLAGDWAQRLYESQGATYRALRAARGE